MLAATRKRDSDRPREAGGAGRSLTLDGAVSPAIVPPEQVAEAGSVVVMDDRPGLEDDPSSRALNLRLPGELLVGIGDGLLLGEAGLLAETRAPDAQVARRVVRDVAGAAAGVHMVPAAVVVAAGA